VVYRDVDKVGSVNKHMLIEKGYRVLVDKVIRERRLIKRTLEDNVVSTYGLLVAQPVKFYDAKSLGIRSDSEMSGSSCIRKLAVEMLSL
jgi:hypothetical protein